LGLGELTAASEEKMKPALELVVEGIEFRKRIRCDSKNYDTVVI
jgi:hypothetical protein